MDSDLYYLVKFLPAYALPAGKPSRTQLNSDDDTMLDTQVQPPSPRDGSSEGNSFHHKRTISSFSSSSSSAPDLLPLPVTTPTKSAGRKTTFLEPEPIFNKHPNRNHEFRLSYKEQVILSRSDEKFLFPAYMPPKYHFFDLFPFSLLVGILTARGKEVKGKTAAKIRSQMRNNAVSHNLPHEISLYLVSWRFLYWNAVTGYLIEI
jgi:ion channel-forming bestrophin family protein